MRRSRPLDLIWGLQEPPLGLQEAPSSSAVQEQGGEAVETSTGISRKAGVQ